MAVVASSTSLKEVEGLCKFERVVSFDREVSTDHADDSIGGRLSIEGSDFVMHSAEFIEFL